MDKVIISVALTGAVTPKETNPHIPLTPEEIAKDAYECYKAGAAVVHLHMRDEKGLGTMNKELFKKTTELVKAKCNVVMNLTTSGDNRAGDDERMAHLIELKPEMASFDAGSFNWMPAGVFTNSPQFLEKLAKVMLDGGVKPEIEVFDSGMIGVAEYYMKKGLIKTPPHFQLCLGVLGAAMATVENLLYLRNLLPKDSTWSAFGIGGKAHLPILYTAIALGGHVRVGLEDNVYYSKDRLATNVEMVERAVRLIKEANKEVATPDEARQILGLKGMK
jgi:3-keto-5-aminohexanoate cleavage enzyme